MSASPGHNKIKEALQKIAPYLGGVLFLIALFVLRHALRKYHYHEIIGHIKSLPLSDVLTALLLTAAGYLVLTGYDAISLSYIRRRLPYRRTAFASYVAYALSHSIGVSTLSGGSVRYRLYSSWGLSAAEVAKVVMFNGITFWTGFSFVGAMIFILRPMPIPPDLHLPISSNFYLGLILLTVVCSYLFVCAVRTRPIRILGLELEVPPISTCFAQISVSSLDWVIAGSVLYVLLRHDMNIPFFDFIGIFLFSQIAGLASQVPGGLGVFEMVALIMLSPYASPSSILGSLLVYRGIYYILPMAAAILMLGTQEVLRKKEFFRKAALSASRAAPVLMPDLAAIGVFVAGATLIISGATPARPERMDLVAGLLPLLAVEVAHVIAGLLGITMLLLARGLQRRLKNAYVLSIAALSFGIVFSLMRGFDYEEALFLLVILVGLLPFSKLFYRTGRLTSQPFSAGWLVAAGLTVACSAAVGIFIYRHAEYTKDLWLKFGYYANAARFFRTTVGASAALVFIAARSLLRPPRPGLIISGIEEIPRAMNIACASRDPRPALSFHAQVNFLFGEKKDSFISFLPGESFNIAIGEPAGPFEEKAELAWQFLGHCDKTKKKPLFYGLAPDNLQLFLDLGLSLVKGSEEAKAPLSEEPPRLLLPEDAGYVFKTLPPGSDVRKFAASPADELLMNTLYLAALFKNDELAAIAPVWQCKELNELMPVYVRTTPEAADAFEPLMAGLFRWGKSNGWKWLRLGDAPIPAPAGQSNQALAEALLRLPYTHREHFKSLAALREFKEKFHPVWEPRYLAMPPGVSPEEAIESVVARFIGRSGIGASWRANNS